MWNDREFSRRYDELMHRLQKAEHPSKNLFDDVISIYPRVISLIRAGRAKRLQELMQAGAWLETALELLRLARSAWSLRRLIRDDEDWVCSLSRSTFVPIEIDDMAEYRHADPAVAVLGALLQVDDAPFGHAGAVKPDRRGHAAQPGQMLYVDALD